MEETTRREAPRQVGKKEARSDWERWLATQDLAILATDPESLTAKAAAAAEVSLPVETTPLRRGKWERAFEKGYRSELRRGVRKLFPAKVARKMDLFCRFVEALRLATDDEEWRRALVALGRIRIRKYDLTPPPKRKPKPGPIFRDPKAHPRYLREMKKLAARDARLDWSRYVTLRTG